METIKCTIQQIIKKYKTNDPYEIASQKNILVLFENLGKTMGYFNMYKRIPMIHINSGLDDGYKRFVCAHELGHRFLHPGINTPFMKKNTYFSASKIEREANIFAIQLLLADEKPEESETIEHFFLRNQVPKEMSVYYIF